MRGLAINKSSISSVESAGLSYLFQEHCLTIMIPGREGSILPTSLLKKKKKKTTTDKMSCRLSSNYHGFLTGKTSTTREKDAQKAKGKHLGKTCIV